MLYRIAVPFVLLLSLALPLAAVEVPRQASELAVALPGGKQLLLSQFKGKVIAVEFMLTTCPHCQQSARLMSQLQSEYGPKGFQAIGVAFNPMAIMLIPDFIKQFGVNFPIGTANPETVHNYLQVPVTHRMVVPQLIYIDRKGVIRGQSAPEGSDDFFQEKNIRATIEKLLDDGGAKKGGTRKK